MKFHRRFTGVVLLVVVLGTPIFSHAAPVSGQGTWETTLQGRDLDGNLSTFEAYYDTVLDITWLANANLAASNTFGVSAITPNGSSAGSMWWSTAQNWIVAMNTNGGTGYLGFNTWRLPTVGPVNGTALNYSISHIGTTDAGYNMSAPGTLYAGSTGSEMAHMFFNTLGNKSFCDPSTSTINTCSGPQTGWGLTNTGPFSNVQSWDYWSGTEYVGDDPFGGSNASFMAWNFYFSHGGQDGASKDSARMAWAVLDGDIAAVPVPATIWLFGSGLAGLIGFARHRKQTA